MLEQQFLDLFLKYSSNISRIKNLWEDIKDSYTKEYRHYHTLEHLMHFYQELLEIKHQVKDWNTVLMAMFYHDIVFLPTRNDNEKSSCELAEVSLETVEIPQQTILKCQKMIMATKKHELSDDLDTNFFTDADLSIIGSDEKTYNQYVEEIKLEYYYLSDESYRIGRSKIIKRLLKMDNLYKTPHFYDRYEVQARKNLNSELKSLSIVTPNRLLSGTHF